MTSSPSVALTILITSTFVMPSAAGAVGVAELIGAGAGLGDLVADDSFQCMRRPKLHERLVSADSPERSRCFVLVEEYLIRSECFVEYRYLGGCANAGTDWVVRCLGRFIRGRWRAVSV